MTQPLCGMFNFITQYESSVETMTAEDAKRITCLESKIFAKVLVLPNVPKDCDPVALKASLVKVQGTLDNYIKNRDWKGVISDIFKWRFLDLYKLQRALPNIVKMTGVNQGE